MKQQESGSLILHTLRALLARGTVLLGQEDGLDVGQDTTLGNGHTSQKLVQLFIVPDGKLKMPGVDPLLLVVAGSVAGQLEDLSGQVLHDSGEVDWGASSDTLGVVALAEKTVDTTDWELKSSTS